MKRTMSILVLALVMVSPATSWADLGITGWFTNNAEFQCNEYERTTLLDAAEVRLLLGESNAIRFENILSNSPPTWLDLISDLSCTRDLLMDSHGAMELGGVSSLLIEPYQDASSARDAYDQYCIDYGDTNFVINDHIVGLTYHGIESLLAPASNSNGMKLIYACRSTFCKEAWGSFNSTDSGGSYFGYPIDIANSIACEDLDLMVRTMVCEDYDSTMLENDILTAYAQSSGEGILYGNQENSFNPAVSCHSWDVAFAGVAAWGGEIHWIAKDEQRYSQYIIEGVDAMGGRPETLCVVNGRGSDGTGVYRSYSASVPQRRYLRVRELDDMFVVTTSDWVMWEDVPGNWPLGPGEEFSLLPLRTTSSGEIAKNRSGRVENKGRFDIEPTDVVVYTTTGYEVIANRIRGSWQMTTDLSGNYLRARTWSGSDDPLDVQDLYRQVYQANQQYNAANPDTPYRARPILQIVGDGVLRRVDEDTVRVGPQHFRWAEGEHGGSGDGGFSSYALMTDIDGDDIPDGPDVVIPLQDYAQAQIHADAVEEWNASGPLGNDVLLCLDDAYGGVAADWMEPRVFGEFVNSYVQPRGLQLKDVLKESDYLPFDDWNETVAQMRADGTNLVNGGVAEVWYTGLAAATSNHTQFMEGVADWTTPQRFLLFGPSCDFGDPTRAASKW